MISIHGLREEFWSFALPTHCVQGRQECAAHAHAGCEGGLGSWKAEMDIGGDSNGGESQAGGHGQWKEGKWSGRCAAGLKGTESMNQTGGNGDGGGSSAAWLTGGFVENRSVYRQNFLIRSYEIGPDRTATMETLMNLLQETALNHVRCSGLYGNGFGATREMSLRNLIWVVTRIHVQVDKYSSWGDVVEIDTWVDAAGKNGMRRDWIIRDIKTQKIITKATSTWAIMNRETRKLSKIPDEVKEEVQPFYLNRVAIPSAEADGHKIEKLTDETADIVRSGLAPRWSDMDANQHVNNVKYIDGFWRAYQ
ncbi:Oleoyl-[acyl-carrier-protein] hydrolase [Bertholletia excelsa]